MFVCGTVAQRRAQNRSGREEGRVEVETQNFDTRCGADCGEGQMQGVSSRREHLDLVLNERGQVGDRLGEIGGLPGVQSLKF